MPEEEENKDILVETISDMVNQALKYLVTEYFDSGVRGLSEVIMEVPVVYRPGNFVACTDGERIIVGDMIIEWKKYKNPVKEVSAVLLHEACHILFDDVSISERLQREGVNGTVINVVCDQWINNPLRNEGYESPPDWSEWIEEQLGEKPWYKYDKITTIILIDAKLQKQKKIKGWGDGVVPTEGTGGFDPTDITDVPKRIGGKAPERGEVVISGGDVDKVRRAKKRAKRAQQPIDGYKKVSITKGVGLGGGEAPITIDKIWTTAKWSSKLVNVLLASLETGVVRSWRVMHRKFPGLYPGRTWTMSQPYIVALIDTSGSMSDMDIARLASGIYYLSRYTDSMGYVVYWSSGEDGYVYMPIDEVGKAIRTGIIENIPRGGTELRCAYEGLSEVIKHGTPETINVILASDFEVLDTQYIDKIRKLSTLLVGVTTTGIIHKKDLFDIIIDASKER